MTFDTDEQILVLMASAATKERGFRLLVSTYQERLYWHIRRMVGSHDDTDDVLQDSLVKAYRGISRFEGKSQLYTWLYRIATNEALSFLKKKGRLSISSLDAETHPAAYQLHAEASVDGAALQRQLERALAALPEKQRLVFNLRYYEEMTYKEMSELLNTSVGALKASYHHAVKKVEAAIKSYL